MFHKVFIRSSLGINKTYLSWRHTQWSDPNKKCQSMFVLPLHKYLLDQMRWYHLVEIFQNQKSEPRRCQARWHMMGYFSSSQVWETFSEVLTIKNFSPFPLCKIFSMNSTTWILEIGTKGWHKKCSGPSITQENIIETLLNKQHSEGDKFGWARQFEVNIEGRPVREGVKKAGNLWPGKILLKGHLT